MSSHSVDLSSVDTWPQCCKKICSFTPFLSWSDKHAHVGPVRTCDFTDLISVSGLSHLVLVPVALRPPLDRALLWLVSWFTVFSEEKTRNRTQTSVSLQITSQRHPSKISQSLHQEEKEQGIMGDWRFLSWAVTVNIPSLNQFPISNLFGDYHKFHFSIFSLLPQLPVNQLWLFATIMLTEYIDSHFL